MSAILSLAIALISGVSAAFVGYRLSARKEHVFFIRKKFEDIYLAAERFQRAYGSYTIGFYSLMRNEITYNQLLDMQNASLEKSSGDVAGYEALAMLIHIYFPFLVKELERIESAKAKVQKVIRMHKNEYKEIGPTDTDWISPFDAALNEFDKAINDLKLSVAKAARNFSSEQSLHNFSH